MILKFLQIYIYLIILRAILSWFEQNPSNPFTRLLFTVTEPVLRPVRRLIPPIGGKLDLSPLIVLIGAILLKLYFVR